MLSAPKTPSGLSSAERGGSAIAQRQLFADDLLAAVIPHPPPRAFGTDRTTPHHHQQPGEGGETTPRRSRLQQQQQRAVEHSYCGPAGHAASPGVRRTVLSSNEAAPRPAGSAVVSAPDGQQKQHDFLRLKWRALLLAGHVQNHVAASLSVRPASASASQRQQQRSTNTNPMTSSQKKAFTAGGLIWDGGRYEEAEVPMVEPTASYPGTSSLGAATAGMLQADGASGGGGVPSAASSRPTSAGRYRVPVRPSSVSIPSCRFRDQQQYSTTTSSEDVAGGAVDGGGESHYSNYPKAIPNPIGSERIVNSAMVVETRPAAAAASMAAATSAGGIGGASSSHHKPQQRTAAHQVVVEAVPYHEAMLRNVPRNPSADVRSSMLLRVVGASPRTGSSLRGGGGGRLHRSTVTMGGASDDRASSSQKTKVSLSKSEGGKSSKSTSEGGPGHTRPGTAPTSQRDLQYVKRLMEMVRAATGDAQLSTPAVVTSLLPTARMVMQQQKTNAALKGHRSSSTADVAAAGGTHVAPRPLSAKERPSSGSGMRTTPSQPSSHPTAAGGTSAKVPLHVSTVTFEHPHHGGDFFAGLSPSRGGGGRYCEDGIAEEDSATNRKKVVAVPEWHDLPCVGSVATPPPPVDSTNGMAGPSYGYSSSSTSAFYLFSSTPQQQQQQRAARPSSAPRNQGAPSQRPGRPQTAGPSRSTTTTIGRSKQQQQQQSHSLFQEGGSDGAAGGGYSEWHVGDAGSQFSPPRVHFEEGVVPVAAR